MNLIPWDGATCPCRLLNQCTCCKLKDKDNFNTINNYIYIIKKEEVKMRYYDLQELCKTCEFMKPWSLDMSGNHGCSCLKHNLEYFYNKTKRNWCEDYKIEEELCKY